MATAAKNTKHIVTFIALHRAAALALAILLMSVAAQPILAQSESCSAQLADLVPCGSYVIPGQPTGQPSGQCCDSLKSVDQDCACNAMKIIQSLPTKCGIPAIQCS